MRFFITFLFIPFLAQASSYTCEIESQGKSEKHSVMMNRVVSVPVNGHDLTFFLRDESSSLMVTKLDKKVFNIKAPAGKLVVSVPVQDQFINVHCENGEGLPSRSAASQKKN